MSRKFNRIILFAIAIFTLTIATPLTTVFARNYNTHTASFNRNMYSHDWNRVYHSEDKGYINVQKLHNGNEIYYAIDPNQSNRNYGLWKQAVNNWNRLGVIKLVQVGMSNPDKEITLTYQNNIHQKSELGYESGNYWYHDDDESNVPNIDNYDYMCDTKAILSENINSKNYSTAKVAATHELGHALGFEHDTIKFNNMPVVMNPYIHASSKLGLYEANTLRHYYGPFLNN